MLREGTPSTDFETTQGVDHGILPAYKDIINIQRNSSEDHITIEEPILSPVSATSDLDDFSVVSGIDAEGSQVLQFTDDIEVLTPLKVLDPSAADSDYLTSLTQRYHSLCRTIDILRDGINKQVEDLNASASAKHERAKMRLEASRRKAQEEFESMKKASTDSKVSIRLPWLLSESGLVLFTRKLYGDF